MTDATVFAAVLYQLTRQLHPTHNAAERARLADLITREVLARHAS